MANYKLNELFKNEMIISDPLDLAIDFISRNFYPEDVFTEDKLEKWAEENGYKKDGE